MARKRKKNKKLTLKKIPFKRVNYLDNFDLIYSPQINDCFNIIQKKNIKYDCNKKPIENLKKLNFFECEPIMIPSKRWKSLKKMYKHRANLLWKVNNC